MQRTRHEELVTEIIRKTESKITDYHVAALLAMTEGSVNRFLDASIAHYYLQTPTVQAIAPLRAWLAFMLGTCEEHVVQGSAHQTYQNAMFTKAIMCSSHAPIGLIRKYLRKGHRVLDIGGGLGFFTAIFQCFGARTTLMEKAETLALMSPTAIETLGAIAEEFPGNQQLDYDFVHVSEVLHGRSKEERAAWFDSDLPKAVRTNGILAITEIGKTRTLYSELFDIRIKAMTKGKGSIVLPGEILDETRGIFEIEVLVTWHSLPYYTLILRKT